MTNDQLQELIDTLDDAIEYVPVEMQRELKQLSTLLVDLPDDVVESLHFRVEQEKDI